MRISRRHFLRDSAAVAVGFLGLKHYLAEGSGAPAGGYGELVPDPARVIDLPKGFRYRIFSRVGEKMDDGFFVPGAHDGMAAFPGPDGKTVLVRNHELRPTRSGGPFGRSNELFKNIDRKKVYDAGRGKYPCVGGTTTLVYDTRVQRLERHSLSLVGTIRNCAGGPTPWGSWLSCEECTDRAQGLIEKDHGYVFEVPASPEIRLADPEPIAAMGRFNHEAVAVDPRSGIVYETEDRSDGLLYRYIPADPGHLLKGGRLQALAIKDKPSAETGNGSRRGAIPVGQPLEVAWVDLQDAQSPRDDLRQQGFSKGASRFVRGEGIWYGNGALFFACTSGGRNRKGQIWKLVPEEGEKPGRLVLFVEPNDDTLMESADNITVAPWGDLIVCENARPEQHVIGITPEGKFYTLAKNSRSNSEFAGGCFSPDGSTFFVNIQKVGLTVAVTGPWKG